VLRSACARDRSVTQKMEDGEFAGCHPLCRTQERQTPLLPERKAPVLQDLRGDDLRSHCSCQHFFYLPRIEGSNVVARERQRPVRRPCAALILPAGEGCCFPGGRTTLCRIPKGMTFKRVTCPSASCISLESCPPLWLSAPTPRRSEPTFFLLFRFCRCLTNPLRRRSPHGNNS
jgi:hypothetical protein